MLKIEREGAHPNRITLTRGDTAVLKLVIRDPCKKIYALHGRDKALLTVKSSPDDSIKIIEVIADKMQQFTLYPEDTKSLSCGKYCYDIQVVFEDGSINTVIPLADFIIAKEMTW